MRMSPYVLWSGWKVYFIGCGLGEDRGCEDGIMVRKKIRDSIRGVNVGVRLGRRLAC